MFHRISFAALAASALFASATSSPASAAGTSPFTAMAGSWSGTGTVRFEGGQSEKLRCRGSYTVKNSGAGMGLALRCASASAKIDLRSRLDYQGGRVSGSWEERTFNASGDVSGRASNGHLSLVIGGGLSGSMSVSFTGSSQSVSIRTSGTGLKGVSISLRRI